jgi:hypothetical protein
MNNNKEKEKIEANKEKKEWKKLDPLVDELSVRLWKMEEEMLRKERLKYT